jgi:MFS family permease
LQSSQFGTCGIENLGIFVGPPLFGWIVDRTGSYAPAWWAMLGAALLAALLLVFVREPRRVATFVWQPVPDGTIVSDDVNVRGLAVGDIEEALSGARDAATPSP